MHTSKRWRSLLFGSLTLGLTAPLITLPAAAAPLTEVDLVINEVIQNNSNIDDAIELLNTGSGPIDLSGWILADDKNSLTIDEGTVIAAGEYLTITTDDDARADKFGLGKNDEASVRTPAGVIVDRFAWEGHVPTSYGRCPDGEGAFVETSAATPDGANACVPDLLGSLVINEVESSDAASGDDWVELVNTAKLPLDLSGVLLSDSNPDNNFEFDSGTVLAAGEFFVVTESEFGFGLGKQDAVTLRTGDTVIDHVEWDAHAAHTLGRNPDGIGAFAATSEPTPGAANVFAEVTAPAIVVNEVETSGGNPGDWIELYNLEEAPVDLSGWVVRDNDDAHTSVIADGTVIEAGGFFVVEEAQLGFGLGKEDSARLYLPGGHQLVDEYAWSAVLDDSHSPTTLGRCGDGTGEWRITTASTKGAPNDCGLPVRINELSSQSDPVGDWVELVNVGYEPADLSGLGLVDTSDKGAHPIAAGTELAAGAYLQVYVYDTFGLGAADAVSLIDSEGTVLDTVAWQQHVTPSLGRCPDGTGEFAATREATPGAANACAGDLITAPWPGADSVTTPTQDDFGADMSGVVYDRSGNIWAVNNGNGTLHQLRHTAGTLEQLAQWTLRYGDGLGTVDAEGVALINGDAAEGVLVASERNTGTGDRGSRPSVLRYALTAEGELSATHEWNLSGFYPGIGANAGLEGIAWISDADLVAAGLVDERTGKVFDPASLPAHGGGIVFVGVEATSAVAGYALGDAGEIIRITEFDTAFPGVMELEYDPSQGELWVLCDDACEGRTQVFTVGANAEAPGAFAAVSLFERPAATPNYANEGFAIAPADRCVAGEREVVWANDSNDDAAAFRFGSLPCEGDTIAPPPIDGGGSPGTDTPSTGNTPGTGVPGTGDDLAATGSAHTPVFVWAAVALVLLTAGTGVLWARRRA